MDMIIEILIRLPVKSIVRFKCVSKDWHSLITRQHFIDRHLLQSRKPLSNRLLILHSNHTRYNDQSNPFCLLSINNPNSNPTKLPLPLPPKKVDSHSAIYKIFGNCNGVICITVIDPVTQMLMLYNPSTRSSRWVKLGKNRDLLGLGHDVITGDYKILAKRNPEFYEIFSLRRNSWKRCGDARFPLKNGFSFNYHSIYMNGALHWFVNRGYGISGWSLLVFDMHNETFNSELLPACFERFNYMSLVLSDLGSDLSLQMYTYQVQEGDKMSLIETLEIWVMKKYGVQESWTKLFAFPTYGLLGDRPWTTTYSSDGTKILVTQSTRARLWYVLKTGDMEAKNDRLCLNHEKLVTRDVCVESLVSLHDY